PLLGQLIEIHHHSSHRRIWSPELIQLPGHVGLVKSVAFSPDGSKIIPGLGNKTIRVWDVSTGVETLPPLRGHNGSILSVAFSPDGSKIISGPYDKTMRVWDAITGIEMLPPLRGHDDSIHSVAFFPDSIVAPMPESFHLKVVSPPDQARSRLGVLSSIMTENPPILGVFVPDPHLLPAVTTIQCHNPWPRVLAAQLDGSKGKRLFNEGDLTGRYS
ncbi:hypothetical protein AX14_005590, partial [Amanita brunnescens Koide BX004]